MNNITKQTNKKKKKVIVISTSLRKGSNSDMLADKFTLCGYDLTMHHHALADAEACARIAIEIL